MPAEQDQHAQRANPMVRRKTFRIVKPSLQWKLIGSALLLSLTTALVQFVVLNVLFSSLLVSPGRSSGTGLIGHIGETSLWGLGVTVLFTAPVVVLFMVLVTMRIAGPVTRFEKDLGAIADGAPPRPIRIREGDELVELCTVINRVLERLPDHESVAPEPAAVPTMEAECPAVAELDSDAVLASADPSSPREQGFTIVEAIVALAVVVVGLVALGAALIPVVRQQEANSQRLQVLNRATSLIEELKGVDDPATLAGTYDGRTYPVDGVEGVSNDNSSLIVAIDDTNPNLIQITVSGEWLFGDETHDLLLRTEVYNP